MIEQGPLCVSEDFVREVRARRRRQFIVEALTCSAQALVGAAMLWVVVKLAGVVLIALHP